MEALARRIALAVSAQTSATEEDREVYEFAARLLVNGVADIAIVSLVAYSLGIFRIVAVAYVMAATMKYFAGGAHASTMLNCVILGGTAFTGIGLAARALARAPLIPSDVAFWMAATLAVIAFILYVPAESPHKPLKAIGQRRRLRVGAMIVLTIVLYLGYAWINEPFSAPEFFWAGCLALVWQSLILFPGFQRLLSMTERYLFERQTRTGGGRA